MRKVAGRREAPGKIRGPIDWEGIRLRLRALEGAVAEAASPSPERSREILEARARALATAASTDAETEGLDLLTFHLGREIYGVEARDVRGVFRLRELSPLPGAPAPVAGLTAWRGELLTVLDVRRLVELPQEGLDDRAWVVALGDGTRTICGLLAGLLGDMVRAREGDLMAAAEDAPGRACVRGVTRDAILVLDVEKILATSHGSPS